MNHVDGTARVWPPVGVATAMCEAEAIGHAMRGVGTQTGRWYVRKVPVRLGVPLANGRRNQVLR